jgi:hypothetical protein
LFAVNAAYAAEGPAAVRPESDAIPAGRVFVSAAPGLEASLVDLPLGWVYSPDRPSQSLRSGSLAASISGSVGLTFAPGLYVAMAGSYSAYFDRGTAGEGMIGSGTTGTVAAEVGHLSRAGLTYKLGLGVRMLSALSRVITDTGDNWEDDVRASFVGPTTYLSGGYAFALGGGFVLTPQASIGLSVVHASSYTLAYGAEGPGAIPCVSNDSCDTHNASMTAVLPTASLALAATWGGY